MKSPDQLLSKLRESKSEIVRLWRQRVLADPKLENASRLSEPALIDHIPDFLDSIIRSLEISPGVRPSAEELGHNHPSREHARLRSLIGYNLSEAILELSHLRAAIFEVCRVHIPSVDKLNFILTAIESAVAEVAGEIVKIQMEERSTHEITSEQLRLLIDGVRDYALFMLDPGGEITSWNPGVERILGYGESEFIGMSVLSLFTQEDLAKGTPGLELKAAMERGSLVSELYLLRKDGSKFWAENHMTVLRDGDGRVRGYSKVISDRTQRKSAEDRLRHAEERYRLLMENVKDHAIITTDPEGLIDSWSFGAERIFGYGPEEATGRHGRFIFTPDDQSAHVPEGEFDKARTEGCASDTRWHIRRDGSLFWAIGSVNPLFDTHGRLRGYSKVLRDGTREKLAQDELIASEERLRENQRHLDLAHKAARSTSWDWDIWSGQIKWSGNAAAVFGCEPPSAFEAFRQLLHFEDLERLDALLERSAREGRNDYEAEFRAIWPDGSLHWVFGRGQLIYSDQGQLSRLTGVNIEITDRKRAETERDRFFEISPDPLAIAGFDGFFRRVNSAWEKALGYTSEELTKKTWLDFLHPEDKAETGKEIKKLWRGHDTTAAFENRFRHKDGGYRWLRWSICSDPNERLVFGAARDVTDLKHSETRFRALANSIPQLAWMTDSGGSITWYNQRWYNFTGTTFDEMKGWGWQAVHHPDHVKRVTEHFKKHIESGEPWEDTFPLRSRDGEWRWFLSRAQPIRDEDGKVVQWFGTNTDVTEARCVEEQLIKAKEAAEEADRSKSAFLASMTHELRTPLGAILGFAELLKEPLLTNEEREQFIETIIRNGKQLSDLIGDVLDLSKIEAGKIEVEHLRVALPGLVSEVITTLDVKAREKGIQLKSEADGPIPDIIETDPLRLRQILFNIIGNAIKFTEHGRVTLTLQYRASSGGGRNHICFIVEDTGRGIPSERQAALFQPFTQADSATSRRYGGTGLGLSISRKLARLLGGDIALEKSEPGKGSRFLITIDAGEAICDLESIDHRNVPESIEAASNKPLQGIRVLLADDSADNQLLARRILESSGAAVETVDNGSEAIQMVIGNRYDVILMDIQMPVMDGYEATRELRLRGYRGPILALTANALREEMERSVKAGCNDHLTKPLNRSRLISTIRQYTIEERM